jgi:hypothetical protein
MKHIGGIAALAGAALAVAVLFASCGSTKPASPIGDSSRRTDPKTYYTGDGGKGMSLAILTPEASGLRADEAYLPALVQGVLVEDFSKYSAIEVLDRQSLDRIIMEGESGAYPEDSGFARFGELRPTQYVLSGSLVKTSSAYQLKITVSDSGTAKTLAAYTGNAARDALDDFSAIKAASLDLLTQMGVDMTAAGKEALWGLDQKDRSAETALAKGVTAQRGGNTVAALNYYSTAGSLNPGLAEAEQRLAALTQKIQSGDIGEDIRNDIQRRNAWIQLLDEAAAFYRENPFYDLVYYVNPDIGKTDYDRNTAPVSYDIWLEPNDGYPALLTIIRALMGTGMADEWGLTGEVIKLLNLGLSNAGGSSYGSVLLEAELLDEGGEYMGTLRGGATAVLPTAPPHYENHLPDAANPVVWQASVFWNQIHSLDGGIAASSVSNGMRLSGIRVMSDAEIGQYGILAGGDYRNTKIAMPFTGEIRVIPTEKNFEEYFRGRRNVEVSNGGAKFTFR